MDMMPGNYCTGAGADSPSRGDSTPSGGATVIQETRKRMPDWALFERFWASVSRGASNTRVHVIGSSMRGAAIAYAAGTDDIGDSACRPTATIQAATATQAAAATAVHRGRTGRRRVRGRPARTCPVRFPEDSDRTIASDRRASPRVRQLRWNCRHPSHLGRCQRVTGPTGWPESAAPEIMNRKIEQSIVCPLTSGARHKSVSSRSLAMLRRAR